ncbi:hypothetical protein OG21DRAFT_1515540 [Imleria badia]|nr:hypothetical protein OG21DRAFT_1515540 [Imleria badia]
MTNTIAGSRDDNYVELPESTALATNECRSVLLPRISRGPNDPDLFQRAQRHRRVRKAGVTDIHPQRDLEIRAFQRPSVRVHPQRPLLCPPNARGQPPCLGAETLPYITILADFGQPSELEVTYTESDVDDRCLRIYAPGIDATIYAFLSNRAHVLTTLEKLVQRQQIPETETPIAEYLAAQFGFGSTGLTQHMHWEHWRNKSMGIVAFFPAARLVYD